jgi:carbon monoxide dehydrogenase subunit G
MLLEGKFALEAPSQKVWDTLLPPNTLLSCVSGAEKIERLDEKTYDCVVRQKVGSISVKFKFKSVFTKVDAPNHLEFDGEREHIDKVGHFVQKSVVDLKETPGEKRRFLNKSDASIVGKLAMFEDRIMRARAKKVQGELTSNLDGTSKGFV